MTELDIGIDLDGVCYDFVASLRHYLQEHEGVVNPRLDEEAETWDFYRDAWGMTVEEFLAASARGVDAGVVFRHGEPLPGSVETLRRFQDQGHRIHIITNRSWGKRSHHNTSDWLEEHEVPFDSLVFSSHKAIMRPDVMVDDHVDNYLAFRDTETNCFLFDRPWNRSLVTNMRVRGWDQFAERVDELADWL